MLFRSKTFSYAKDPDHPEQDQDAWQVVPEKGLAVIADGVSSAIFSAAWAKILTESVAAAPPDPENKPVLAQWLAARRKEWQAAVNTENLAWYQKPKLAAGAFSTLLWVTLQPCDFPPADWPGDKTLLNSEKACFWLSGYAIGDSCLFHTRPGRPDFGRYDGTDLLHFFPLKSSADFEASPAVLGSVDLGRDSVIEFQPIGIVVQEGDSIILATDAVSQWAMRMYEAGKSPEWGDFDKMAESDWRAVIDGLRSQGRMRYDDATLIMLQVEEKSSRKTPPPPPKIQEAEAAGTEYYEELDFSNDSFRSSPEEAENSKITEYFPQPSYVPKTSQNKKPPAQTPPVSLNRKAPPQKPAAESPPAAPAKPGFHYSLASRKDVPPREGTSPSQNSSSENPSENSWTERGAEIGSQVTRQLGVFREQGARIAENVGDKISDGMNTVGEMTHQMVDAAKPRIQKAIQGVMDFFKKSKTEEEAADASEEALRREREEAARRNAAARKSDPARRKFYNPKNEENKKDE